MAGRGLISKLSFISSSAARSAARSAAGPCGLFRAFPASRSSPLLRLRPLLTLSEPRAASIDGSAGIRCFSTRPATSSLNDPSPNWSNRPPKETILLDGCDFEHWLVVVEPPDPNWTREEIIDSYIKTLAQVVGSEEKARHSIYSVSTKHYFAFGALVSEELSYKIKALPKVRWVLPDSYLNVKEKDYGGEPFINGEAVPYHPKYHEEWVRNNARANERSRRNDRPRNHDRSRNFERRRENMQSYPNRDAPPGNQSFQNPVPPVTGGPNTMPPRPGNQSFQNPVPPVTGSQNTMPPREMPPVPSGNFNPPGGNTNNDGQTGGPYYPNQMPSPQNTYGQNDGRGMPTAPAFHGNSTQGYQGGPNYQQGMRPPFQQGPPPSFQRGNAPPAYQQGPPPPNYQQGIGGFQQGPPPPNYQQGTGGFQQGPPPPSYQQGGSPAFQQNANPAYQPYAQSNQSGEAYQVRDVPGRDQ